MTTSTCCQDSSPLVPRSFTVCEHLIPHLRTLLQLGLSCLKWHVLSATKGPPTNIAKPHGFPIHESLFLIGHPLTEGTRLVNCGGLHFAIHVALAARTCAATWRS